MAKRILQRNRDSKGCVCGVKKPSKTEKINGFPTVGIQANYIHLLLSSKGNKIPVLRALVLAQGLRVLSFLEEGTGSGRQPRVSISKSE